MGGTLHGGPGWPAMIFQVESTKKQKNKNAALQLHLSSFSIVLLPRLCTWSLNTFFGNPANKTTSTAEGKSSFMETYCTHTVCFLEVTQQISNQQPNDSWPTKKPLESSLIWGWYVWLYSRHWIDESEQLLATTTFNRQMTLAPNLQIFPKKTKQETEPKLCMIMIMI